MSDFFSNSPENTRARGDVEHAHAPRLRKKSKKDEVWASEFHERFGYAADEFLQPAVVHMDNREKDLKRLADNRQTAGDTAYSAATAFEGNDVDNASRTRRTMPEA